MTLIIVSELICMFLFGPKLKIGFCAYSVCAAATFERSQYAPKLLLRILSMRKSGFCTVLICTEAALAHTESAKEGAVHSEYAQKLLLGSLSLRQSFWENVRVCAHQQLLRILSTVCASATFEHSKYSLQLFLRILSMRIRSFCAF